MKHLRKIAGRMVQAVAGRQHEDPSTARLAAKFQERLGMSREEAQQLAAYWTAPLNDKDDDTVHAGA